jgi:hypothetical protein
MKRSSVSVAAVTFLALGLVAADAGAQYSGFIKRNVCPSYAVVSWFAEYPADEFQWQPLAPSLCRLFPGNIADSVAIGWIAIPFDSSDSSEDVTMKVTVHGQSGSGSGGQVCIQSFEYDEDGSLLGDSGTPACSTGSSVNVQSLTTTVSSVPVGGGVVTSISGEGSSTVDMVSMQYTAVGFAL